MATTYTYAHIYMYRIHILSLCTATGLPTFNMFSIQSKCTNGTIKTTDEVRYKTGPTKTGCQQSPATCGRAFFRYIIWLPTALFFSPFSFPSMPPSSPFLLIQLGDLEEHCKPPAGLGGTRPPNATKF